MSVMLFLALLIVVVSGLVAYVGDWIGRKMGRKRLSLLGLRPRYTAIVISVAAGMLIAILTLTTAFITSQNIRDSFIVPINTWRKKLSEQRQALDAAKDALAGTQQQLDTARDKAAGMTKTLSAEQHKLKDANNELDSVRAQRQAVQQRLDLASRNLQDVETQLRQRKDEVGRSLDALKRYAEEIKRLESESTRLRAEQARLKSQIEQLDAFVYANFTPLAFASGQEIITGLFPTGGSAATRRQMLIKLLMVAEKVVRQQCRELPSSDAAMVFLRERDKRVEKVTQAEAIEAISARIASVNGVSDALVRLVPANNVPVNGQAFIAVDVLEIVPNAKVFAAGDEVARVEINVTAQVTTADILGRLVDELLRDKVPTALRKKQMPLILRRFDDQQPMALPATSLSLVSWSDLLAAAEKARSGTGPVSIVARSRGVLKRFDPLELTLEVSPSR